MAKYTFEQVCAKDVYTTIATGVNELACRLPVAGRLIVQDSADTDPAANATNFIPVGEDYPVNIVATGLEVCYMPMGEYMNGQASISVFGMKK